MNHDITYKQIYCKLIKLILFHNQLIHYISDSVTVLTANILTTLYYNDGNFILNEQSTAKYLYLLDNQQCFML